MPCVEIRFWGDKMAGRRKKRKKQGNLKYEVMGVSLIALAVIVLLSLYNQSTGLFGNAVRSYLFGLFGRAGYGIPLFLLLGGGFYLAKYDSININARTLSLLFLFFAVTAFIHLISAKGQLVLYRDNMGFWANLLENTRVAVNWGRERIGGGIVGAIISICLIKLLGLTGSKVLTISLIIIFTTIVSDKSIVSIFIKTVKAIARMLRSSARAVADFMMVPVIKGGKNENKESPKNQVMEGGSISIEEKNKIIDEKIRILDYTGKCFGENSSKDMPLDGKPGEMEVNLHRGNYLKEYTGYRLPPTSLLNSYEGRVTGSRKDLLASARKLEETLKTFGVDARVIQVSVGPTITRYEIQPSPGVKVSRIINLADDIALNMAAISVRIEAPIPGKSAVGLEIPNREMVPVSLKEIVESSTFKNHPSNIAVALGKDIAGNPVVVDLSKMPHLLIAGATGSGKSVCINSLITSLLFKASPAHVKMIMIDPKMVELNHYNDIPHLLAPVVTDPRKATNVLNWAVQEMNNRYKEFSNIGVKDLFRYNQVKQLENKDEYMPQIVIIIDELSDLMMVSPAEVEDAICRLAQMARAAGIHLVVATQRPSVDVITGLIKANIPSRISFAVSSQVDSRTILDMAGAEKLLGKGDMLFLPIGESKPVRVQGAMVAEEEIERVVNYIKRQVKAEYDGEVIEATTVQDPESLDRDELLPRAIEIVVQHQQASASLLQRKLKIGYARAARIIDQLEERGIVGAHEGSKPRKVLVSKEELEKLNNAL